MIVNEILCYSQQLLIISDGRYHEEFEKLNYKFGFPNSNIKETHRVYIDSHKHLFSNSQKITNEKVLKLHGNEWKILKNDHGLYIKMKTFDLKKVRRFIVAYLLQFLDISMFHCFHGGAIKINKKIILLLGNSGAGKTTLSNFATSKGYKVFSENFSLLFNWKLTPFYDHRSFLSSDYKWDNETVIFVALNPGSEKLKITETELKEFKDLSVTHYFFNIFNNHSKKNFKKAGAEIDNYLLKSYSKVYKLSYTKNENSVSEVFNSIVNLTKR